MTDDGLRVAALLVPCLLGLWTAVACRRAHDHGVSGSDALVWAGLSAVFFLLSLIKTARGKFPSAARHFAIRSKAMACR